jgi:hypothetical protein
MTGTPCGLPHHTHTESTCTDRPGHAGPHAGPLIIDGREIGSVAWDEPAPTADLDRCPAAHGSLGRLCKLPTGHPGMHIGSGPNGGATWFGDAS